MEEALLLTLSLFIPTIVAQCRNEPHYCSYGITYVQANQHDCSRFVRCVSGSPLYYQCRRKYVFDFCLQKCVPVMNDCDSTQECFCVQNQRCVVQRQKAPDFDQAESDLSKNGIPPFKGLPKQETSGDWNLYSKLPGGSRRVRQVPFSPLAPYMPQQLGIGLNMNYNPFYGWGLNANLGYQASYNPYATSPWYNYVYLPGPAMNFLRNGQPTNAWMPFMLGQTTAAGSNFDSNAVSVTDCVPFDPSSSQMPDSTTRPYTTTAAPVKNRAITQPLPYLLALGSTRIL